MRMRWRALRERIAHVDAAMEARGKGFAGDESTPSNGGSLVSRAADHGDPGRGNTPPRSVLGRSNPPSGEGEFAAMNDKGGKVLATPARPSTPGHVAESCAASKPNIRRRWPLTQSRDPQSTAVTSSSRSSLYSLEDSDLVSAIQKPEIKTSSERRLNANLPDAPEITQTIPSPGEPTSPPTWPTMYPRSASRMSQSSPLISRIPIPQSEPRGDLHRSPSRFSQTRSDLGSAFLRARSASPTVPRLSRSASASVISDDEELPTSLMQRTVTLSTASNGGLLGSQRGKNKRQSLLPVPKGEQSTLLTHPVSIRIGADAANAHNSEAMTPARPPRSSSRPKPAPSSFHQPPGSSAGASRPPSRLHSPRHNSCQTQWYVPGNPKDPLDLEVATIVNSVSHGFCVERVDPHLRRHSPPGEEIKAQYSFSNALGTKVLTCKLLVIQRASPRTLVGHVQTKKVMCRVGGGR